MVSSNVQARESSTMKGPLIGAIVGAVVGGLIVLIIIAVLFYVLLRRMRKKAAAKHVQFQHVEISPPMTVDLSEKFHNSGLPLSKKPSNASSKKSKPPKRRRKSMESIVAIGSRKPSWDKPYPVELVDSRTSNASSEWSANLSELPLGADYSDAPLVPPELLPSRPAPTVNKNNSAGVPSEQAPVSKAHTRHMSKASVYSQASAAPYLHKLIDGSSSPPPPVPSQPSRKAVPALPPHLQIGGSRMMSEGNNDSDLSPRVSESPVSHPQGPRPPSSKQASLEVPQTHNQTRKTRALLRPPMESLPEAANSLDASGFAELRLNTAPRQQFVESPNSGSESGVMSDVSMTSFAPSIMIADDEHGAVRNNLAAAVDEVVISPLNFKSSSMA